MTRLSICEVCRTEYPWTRSNRKYCSHLCAKVATAWNETQRRGTRPEDEEVIATRDRAVAAELVRTARDRGCERIHPRASGGRYSVPAYYSAWCREGVLWIVRVRWPDGERIAA